MSLTQEEWDGLQEAMRMQSCAWCGRDCQNEDPFAWDEGFPYCSELCFETARDEDIR